MLEQLTNFQTWVAIISLASMLIALDLDNVVFISVLSGRLSDKDKEVARQVGLFAGIAMRITLLLTLSYFLDTLKSPLLSELGSNKFEHPFTGKNLIMLLGGLFLLYKATIEIHNKVEGINHHENSKVISTLGGVLSNIIVLDLVFSVDSIITAVGMTEPGQIVVMIGGVIISMLLMYLFSKGLSTFITKHPTMKMLALSFLLLVGVLLVAEGFHFHFDKSYIYFAMGFSLIVELLNIRARGNLQRSVIH